MTLTILNCFYDTFIVILRSILSLIVQAIHSNSMGKKNEQNSSVTLFFSQMKESHWIGVI